jgi:hypothetical protein
MVRPAAERHDRVGHVEQSRDQPRRVVDLRFG